jgi:ABC-type transport system involved in cytochrome c biogenesis permease subunit
MNSDPILDEVRKYILRSVYFVLLSASIGLVTFAKFMSPALEFEVVVLPPALVLVCVPSDANVTARIAFLSMCVGTLLTTVVFLLLARWWQRRSELPRRGARLESEERRQ